MSTTPIIETKTETKRVRSPALSGKYIKFQVFGFWLCEQLKSSLGDDENVDIIGKLHEQLKLFSDVNAQTEYFEQFFVDLKSSTKDMKMAIKEHSNISKKASKKKSVKAEGSTVRGRKKKETVIVNQQDQIIQDLISAAQDTSPILPSQPVEPAAFQVNETEPVVTAKPTTKKVSKSSKKVAETVSEAVVSETVVSEAVVSETVVSEAVVSEAVVSEAVVSETVVSEAVVSEAVVSETVSEKPSRKYTRKPKPVTLMTNTLIEPIVSIPNTTPVVSTEVPVDTESKNTKGSTKSKAKAKSETDTSKPPKTKSNKSKIEKVVTEPTTKTLEEGEEEEEIEASRFQYKGKSYLIDDNKIVYEVDNFETVGKYDEEKNEIVPL